VVSIHLQPHKRKVVKGHRKEVMEKTFVMPDAMNVTTFLKKCERITFTYAPAIRLNELSKKEIVLLKEQDR